MSLYYLHRAQTIAFGSTMWAKFLHSLTLGTLLLEAKAAFNIYSSLEDFPDGVDSNSACGKALNSSIACDGAIGLSIAGAALDSSSLTALCSASCYQSLMSYRATISSTCDSSVVLRGTDATFPITYLVDNLIFTYNTTCIKDKTTGNWCAQFFNSSWSGTTTDQGIENLPTSVLCSSCVMQNLLISQQSVIGYDPDFVSTAWPTIQSKCGITTSITDPGQAHINLTTPDPGPRTCLSGKTYTVKSGDNCQTIATASNVATNDLITINSILPGCSSLWVGQVLCLPFACETYTVQSGDTCNSIVASRPMDMTLAQLLTWNSFIDPWCSNLIAGETICVRTPGGAFTPNPSSGGSIPTGTLITSATPAPTGTAPGAPTNCGRWYIVSAGETCNTVILSQGITMADFRAANPQINDGCTNLWADTAYCVYQVIKGPVPSSYVNPPSTIAHGTTTNCYQYYTAVSGDTCTSISYSQVASVTDILRWNLGLNAQCSNLAVDSSYCVWGDPEGASTTASTSTGSALPTATLADPSLTASFSCTYTWCDATITTAPVTVTSTASSAAPTTTGVPRPSNAAPNSTTSCKKWYTVVSGDYCYLICQNQGCTVPDLQTWNPDLGTDCVAQLGVAYCVSA
ncbi:unnamed protein product [Rhizoctonia solani]|uniref:LysM domain-containing protein n=1 Tax=Rhizoctonia solani TaxID=456999 RepID=A0A8H3CWY5_9AGAM|nr:unnamed protein product [Rhizoctonia solani]